MSVTLNLTCGVVVVASDPELALWLADVLDADPVLDALEAPPGDAEAVVLSDVDEAAIAEADAWLEAQEAAETADWPWAEVVG